MTLLKDSGWFKVNYYNGGLAVRCQWLLIYDEFISESDKIQIENDLGERLGLENSFFGLPLVCNSKYPNFIHYIYPMYWNNRSNIIQKKKINM